MALLENSDICSREYLRLLDIRKNKIHWSNRVCQQCVRAMVIIFKLFHSRNLVVNLNSESQTVKSAYSLTDFWVILSLKHISRRIPGLLGSNRNVSMKSNYWPCPSQHCLSVGKLPLELEKKYALQFIIRLFVLKW